MKIATILFTYNRSWHTKQVLEALATNIELPEKLFVFQDGLKEETHRAEWEEVSRLIGTVDFCPVEVHIFNQNRGLAKSIVNGINYVFNNYDAVIVLEDDCVPMPNFISFMRQNFEKYVDDKRVYSISGYAWPINIKKNLYDVYGCGRISSWGWGTWKDRWSIYKKDYEIIRQFKNDKELSHRYALWGKDLENILISNISGNSDSWAVFWALEVIYHNGICINPYMSLIKNIGMDGSGIHCGVTRKFDVLLDDTIKKISLPEKVSILDETKTAFADLYGSYTAISAKKADKENILVYGMGNFFLKYEKEVNKDYNIIKFVDKYKKGFFAGKEIVKPDEIEKCDYDKILVMVQDVQMCIEVVRLLLNLNINYMKIIAGIGRYGNFTKCFDDIKVTKNGELVLRGGYAIKVNSEDEFNNVYEVLVNRIYHYNINNDRQDIVFDVGMNIGDSSLFFSTLSKVKKVYAYEPFKKTYLAAVDNIQTNLKLSDKIEAFPYGISDKNCIKVINFNSSMTCGQSTIEDVRQLAYERYLKMGLLDESEETKETIEVKDVAEVFLPIINEHKDCNFILKIDCEGEEYNIIDKLSKEQMLDKFCLIMLEWHYRGNKNILQSLDRAGFSYWCEDKNDMGLIYAYKD